MTVVSLPNLKTYLGITTSDQDAVLQVLLDGTETWLWSYLGADLTSQEYTQYYDGAGQRELVLKNYPVLTSPALTFHYNTGTPRTPNRTAFDTEDYIVYEEKGIIQMINTTLERGHKNMKVVYTAGYSTVPKDITMAIYKLIDFFFQQKGSEGIKLERADDVQIEYDKTDIPTPIVSLLSRYKRYV